jgi:hypothetical protein
MTFEPHRIICVFCVHLLPASAQKSFLSLRVTKLTTRANLIRIMLNRSAHRDHR